MRRVLWAVLLSWVWASTTAAETRQFHGVIFDVPDAWRVASDRDGYLRLRVAREDEKCGDCLGLIAPGVPKSGSIDAFLIAHKGRFLDDEDTERAEILETPQITKMGSRNAAYVGVKYGRRLLYLFAFEAGDKYHLFGFRTKARSKEEIAEATEILKSGFFPLLDSVRYVAEGAQPLLPEAKPGKLQGLWKSDRLDHMLGIDGMMTSRVVHNYFVFWPDGHMFKGTPQTGLQPLDRAAQIAAGNKNFGVYSQRWGKLTIHYADGRSESWDADGRNWKSGFETMRHQRVLEDGSPLQGKVSSFFFSGFTPGAGLSGGVASSSGKTFLQDGRWQSSKFTSVSASGGNVGVTGSNTDKQHGTYIVRDGVAILTLADGTPGGVQWAYHGVSGAYIGGKRLKE